MTDRKRVTWKTVVPGAVLALAATAALAEVFGASSLADFLTTSGHSQEFVIGAGQGQNGADLQKLVISAHKDTSVSPAAIAGTITYTADNGVSQLTIGRFIFEVRDPGTSDPWSPVCDVTAPDPRITATSTTFVFQDNFTINDMTSGYEYRVRVFTAATDSTPAVRFHDAYCEAND